MSRGLRLDEVYRISADEARRYSHLHLLAESLWAALCKIDDPAAVATFEQQGVDRRELRHQLRQRALAKARLMERPDKPEVRISKKCFALMKEARSRANKEGECSPTPATCSVN